MNKVDIEIEKLKTENNMLRKYKNAFEELCNECFIGTPLSLEKYRGKSLTVFDLELREKLRDYIKRYMLSGIDKDIYK